MVESAAAIGAGEDERGVLLATKLHAPRLPTDVVPRARLTARPDRVLVLVCAPAGYGKTTLLAGWARLGWPFAWLSLDAADNDPARFWRHVVAALDGALVGLAEHLSGLLGPPAPKSFDGVVTALINEMEVPATGAGQAAADQGVHLIVDDYHVITSPAVHQSLAYFIDHAPAGLRITVASRTDPPLPLARLRVRGQLAEVRAADLRFTPSEAAALLRDGSGADLSDGATATLTERTEGWAAGLQLAALSLRGRADVDRFVAAFNGSHRFVLDYLVEEVLDKQSEPIRTFLLETSILQRFNAALCNAVTGRTDSQTLLEQVEAAGLFLIPLDDVRGWWRYHHLFADLLRARLSQWHPDRATELHRAATVWFQERALADEAIHHALAANDPVWAARLVEIHFDEVFNLRGEQETIDRWLPVIPDIVVQGRPRLLLARAQMASMRGDLQVSAPLVDAAERAWANAGGSADGENFEPSSGRAASLLINVPAMIALARSYEAQLRGDADTAQRYTEAALEKIAAGESMLMTSAQGFSAVAHWMRGDLAAAEQKFAANVDSWRAAGHVTATAWGDYCLARLQRARGHLDAAARTAARALEFAGGQHRLVPASGPAHTVLALVAYQRNQLDTALEHLDVAIRAGRQFVHSPPLAAALATLAWVRQVRGDVTGAREAMDEARQIALGPDELFNPIPAQHARLLLTQGDVAGAARWVDEQGLGPDALLQYTHEAGHIVLARVLLAQARPQSALPLLDRLHAAAQAAGRTQTVIETGALRALALDGLARRSDAIDALEQALVIGHSQRYLRVFADEGAPMASLLRQLLAADRAGRHGVPLPFAYLADLRHAFDTGQPESDIVPAGMLDPLTNRELEILRLLASGVTNQTIAAELFVTLDTVKKHVSHVLRKLNADNRTAAVARARELQLIDPAAERRGRH